jgi:hypothetical protein
LNFFVKLPHIYNDYVPIFRMFGEDLDIMTIF